MTADRIAVFGGDDLRSSVIALGFEPALDGVRVAVIDLRDADSVERAAASALAVPRVFICPPSHQTLLAAVGVPAERLVADESAAVLGPHLMAALPAMPRGATRTVAVTATRGGVGRTLLVTNLARRIAGRRRVCVIDATGSGAVGWWLGQEARPWNELESLAEELTPDQLAIVATDAGPALRVVGGSGMAPSEKILEATIRAASHLDELVMVDLPIVFSSLARSAIARVDRTLLVSDEDALSLASLDQTLPQDAWLIASRSTPTRLGIHEVFRALPRDEGAVRAAGGARAKVGGALGRAYDDLAALLVIDAS